MAIHIKTPQEIEKMRVAGRLAAQVLEMIEPYVVPGVSTEALDQRCHEYIVQTQKAVPAPLGYPNSHPKGKPFPKSICTSVNEQVCHGVPGPYKLKSGDIINIDVTVLYEGYHGDTSKTFLVGETKPYAKALVQVTRECLLKAIALVKPGCSLGEIGATIEQHAEAHRYSVVHEYCGHGIGSEFHESDFQVLHYAQYDHQHRLIPGLILEPGMTFTIEPMINLEKGGIKLLTSDYWTVVTKDRKLSAQWEHTLLVTETGHEVLTRRTEETDL